MKTLWIILGLVAVLAMALAAYMVKQNNTLPDGLGVHGGRLAPLPSSPNAVSSQTELEEKHVEPLPFQGSAKTTKQAIKDALAAYGNMDIITEEPLYIHAVHTTGTLHFHDDLEFFLDESARVVHFRSASRVGYSDMGLNRARFEQLRDLLQKAEYAGQ